jgi:homoserine kinase type II
MDVRQANKLFEQMERLSAEVTAVRDALRVEFLSSQLAEVVDTDYDLGAVARVEQVLGGYVNLSFAVVTRRDDGEHRYFVRKYNRAVIEREVRFEHALVRHLSGKGFHLAAEVFPTRTGETFVTRRELLQGEEVTRFFAVYEMLSGEDKYTWIKNRCTDREYDSSARVLAQFHYLAHDFVAGDLARQQPPIMQMMRELPEAFRGFAAASRGTAFDQRFLEQLPRIQELLAGGAAIEGDLEGQPRVPVHCDYHPGNLKYADERGVGLFDFDWSKLDYRLFDVAEGIAYFCSSWEGPDDGEVRLDKAAIFVRAYQDEAALFPVPGPLTATELALLPRMVANANLYILNWDLAAYYEDPSVSVDEYLMYLDHQLLFMEYIEDHLDELARLASPPAAAGASGGPGEGEGGA